MTQRPGLSLIGYRYSTHSPQLPPWHDVARVNREIEEVEEDARVYGHTMNKHEVEEDTSVYWYTMSKQWPDPAVQRVELASIAAGMPAPETQMPFAPWQPHT